MFGVSGYIAESQLAILLVIGLGFAMSFQRLVVKLEFNLLIKDVEILSNMIGSGSRFIRLVSNSLRSA